MTRTGSWSAICVLKSPSYRWKRTSTCAWIESRNWAMRRAVNARDEMRRSRACLSPSVRLMNSASKSMILKKISWFASGSRAIVPSAQVPLR